MKFYINWDGYRYWLEVDSNAWPDNREAALIMAVQKWEAIVNFHETHPGDLLWGIGDTTCALCRLYLSNRVCDGCPVFDHTHLSHCDGTPFDRYLAQQWSDHNFLEPAREELAFLRSLLEKQ